MREGVGIFLQAIFCGAFFLMLLAGAYLYKNDKAIFGPSDEAPSETAGARSYNRMQVWIIWVHLTILIGIFTLVFR